MKDIPEKTLKTCADILLSRYGLEIREDQQNFLANAITRAMTACGLTNPEEFASKLEKPGENEAHIALLNTVTTGETFFFRHWEQFEALRDKLLPAIVDAKMRDRERLKIRVWSVGCASGAEPYSAAMLLHEYFAGDHTKIEVLGTDISETALREARNARYDQRRLRHAPQSFFKYFVKVGRRYFVRPEIQEVVRFKRHNVLKQPEPGPWDVILLRNVLIYFQQDTAVRVLKRLQKTLAPWGYIILAAAEAMLGRMAGLKSVPGTAVGIFQAPPIEWTNETNTKNVQAHNQSDAVRPTEPKVREAQTAKEVYSTGNGVSLDDSDAFIEKLIVDGAFEQALDLCSKRIEKNAVDGSAYILAAQAALRANRSVSEVERFLRKAIFLANDNAVAHFLAAQNAVRAGDTEQARRACRRAMHLLNGKAHDNELPLACGTSVAEIQQKCERICSD